jgi:hypothetical protein
LFYANPNLRVDIVTVAKMAARYDRRPKEAKHCAARLSCVAYSGGPIKAKTGVLGNTDLLKKIIIFGCKFRQTVNNRTV